MHKSLIDNASKQMQLRSSQSLLFASLVWAFIDEVMRHINEAKTANATIILADGSAFAASTAGMSFKDISGEFLL